MILISLGANMPGPCGSPRETLAAVPAALAKRGIKVTSISRQWLTAPVPMSADPWYHNAVAVVETKLTPEGLIQALKDTEQAMGRADFTQNAPRALDLDLIAYDDVVLSTQSLYLPHPRLQERAFVLLPLMEIAPDWAHPVSGKSVSQMIKALPKGQEARPVDEAA